MFLDVPGGVSGSIFHIVFDSGALPAPRLDVTEAAGGK